MSSMRSSRKIPRRRSTFTALCTVARVLPRRRASSACDLGTPSRSMFSKIKRCTRERPIGRLWAILSSPITVLRRTSTLTWCSCKIACSAVDWENRDRLAGLENIKMVPQGSIGGTHCSLQFTVAQAGVRLQGGQGFFAARGARGGLLWFGCPPLS